MWDRRTLTKNGRKYHYYVSQSDARFGAPGKSYERLRGRADWSVVRSLIHCGLCAVNLGR